MTNDMLTRREIFVRKLRERKNDEYELIGDYTNVRERTTFKHRKCGHVWDVRPHTLISAKGTLGCPNCQYIEKANTMDQFKAKLLEVHQDKYTVVEGQTYKNNRTKLNMLHNKCGTVFSVSPASILQNDSCPSCRPVSKKRKTTEMFEKELYERWGDEYVLTNNAEYRGANEKIEICHTACGHEWSVRAAHILYRSGCPSCNESRGERFVADYLTSRGIIFERQYKFKDCVNHKELPFDFAVLDSEGALLCLIEYDGIQHFKPFKHFGGVAKFKKTQKNDRIKNKYCSDNNIRLLRIPYTKTSDEIIEEINMFIVEK
jgi:hypothetical protein